MNIVLFDVGNVVVRAGGKQAAQQRLVDEWKVPADRADMLYGELYVPFNIGNMSGRQYRDKLCEHFGVEIPLQALKEIFGSEIYGLDEGVVSVLDELKRKVPLGFFTNTNEWQMDIIRRMIMLEDYVDSKNPSERIFRSHEMGLFKPDIEAYNYVIRRLGADQVYFIDDKEENVRVGESLGWNVHQFTDADSLKAYVRTKFD